MHPVCACVDAGVCALVCHTDFSKTTTVMLQIFCQLIVLMNFHDLENFLGFVDLGLKISE